MMRKKGMSDILTTLIIILLILVAVGVVWTILKKVLDQDVEISQAQARFFSERVEIKNVKYNETTSNVTLKLKKLSGTVVKTGIEIIPGEPIDLDVISVVDLSGSIGESGSLDSVKIANLDLIEILFNSTADNRLGLVGYGDDVIEAYSIGLTNDKVALTNVINSWFDGGYTRTCAAIDRAHEDFGSSSKQKVMIVMSDGNASGLSCVPTRHPANLSLDAIEAACNASNDLENLTIHAIGFGDLSDETTLRAIANCGGGEYVYADDVTQLISVYQQLAEQIKATYKTINTFTSLRIVFLSEEDSYYVDVYDAPAVLETMGYEFNLDELDGELIRIEIYPLVTDSSGNEIVGNLIDFWNI